MKISCRSIFVLSIFGLSACSQQPVPEQDLLRFSSDVGRGAQIELAQAVLAIDEFPVSDPTENFLSILQTEDASPATLKKWIGARVRYAISPKFNLEQAVRLVSEDYAYENADDLPIIDEAEHDSDFEPEEGEDVQTGMANLGVGLYHAGKVRGELYSIRLPGLDKTIEISTPRVGLIQAGNLSLGSGSERLESIYKLAQLIHEARHSDGHGEGLGFLHRICPDGHDYDGYLACDDMENGAYAVGAELIKNIAISCVECTDREKQVLQIIYADSKGRLIGNGTKILDPTPEGLGR